MLLQNVRSRILDAKALPLCIPRDISRVVDRLTAGWIRNAQTPTNGHPYGAPAIGYKPFKVVS